MKTFACKGHFVLLENKNKTKQNVFIWFCLYMFGVLLHVNAFLTGLHGRLLLLSSFYSCLFEYCLLLSDTAFAEEEKKSFSIHGFSSEVYTP